MTDKIIPCIWYDTGQASKAAEFYMSLGLPDSRVDRVHASPADNPSSPEGAELMVEFTLAGRPYLGLNGGPIFPQTEAVSFMIMTEDQAETDPCGTPSSAPAARKASAAGARTAGASAGRSRPGA